MLLPYVRFSKRTTYLPNKFFTKAYDQRMLYVTNGSGVLELKECEYKLKKGSFAYYPTGTSYYPKSDVGEKMEFVTVNFDFNQDYCNEKRVLNPVPEKHFISTLSKPTHMLQPFSEFYKCIFISDAGYLLRDFLELADECDGRHEFSQELACLTLSRILYKIISRKSGAHGDLIHRVKECVALHYSSGIDNRRLAEKLGYHPYYLNSLFKQSTGMTIHEYITEYRIDISREMLAETDKTVAEIASECGFVNPNHFSYRFKRIIGVTPLEYRKTRLLI